MLYNFVEIGIKLDISLVDSFGFFDILKMEFLVSLPDCDPILKVFLLIICVCVFKIKAKVVKY